jgi:adenylosuccinate synthase
MQVKILLISGAVATGKSSLCKGLYARFGVKILKTKNIIQGKYPHAASERRALQELGDELDKKTSHRWVRDELHRYIHERLSDESIVAVDAVRKTQQVDAIRKAFGPRVFHIHLTASEHELTKRYVHRRGSVDRELRSYSSVRKGSKTEQRIEELEHIADAIVSTDRSDEQDVLVRVASQLGLYGRELEQLVDVVVGGQFGSEGKGHICSFLAPEYDVLVRVGGPNAGHKVFQDPVPYTHRQLPSGTLFSNAKLLIGPGAVIDVDTLLKEAAECDVDATRLFIDPQAMVINKADKESEAKLVQKIGSTGQGVGAAAARRIIDREQPEHTLARDIPELSRFCRPIADELEDAYARRRRILLEGTQGTGLSIFHGSYPHVTSRDTTVSGALSEAGISPSRVRRVIMVCRSYVIRVQSPKGSSSGPMRIGRGDHKGELSWKEISRRSKISEKELKGVELGSVSKKERRVGEFDWVLLRRASLLNAPTDIALTFADYIDKRNSEARRFEQLTAPTIRFTEEIEKVASAPVSLVSTRFHWKSIIDRRTW